MRVPFSLPVRGLVTAGAVLAGIVTFAEAAHWRSSHRRLGDGRAVVGSSAAGPRSTRLRTEGSDQIIVVLGYANHGQRANGINRFRVRAGLRSIDPAARSFVVIFCGGAVSGQTPEALILERFARDDLGYTGRSLVETLSRTTWENIANAIPLIDAELTSHTTISIVSNSHHAEKARDHLWQMRPDLAGRLVRGGDWRFGEHPVVKVVAAARGLLALSALDHENAQAAKRRPRRTASSQNNRNGQIVISDD